MTVVNSTTNSTTTGSTITVGKGTTGATTLMTGTDYTLTEVMARIGVNAIGLRDFALPL